MRTRYRNFLLENNDITHESKKNVVSDPFKVAALENQANRIIEIIEKDCRPFLKQIKNTGGFIYRVSGRRPGPMGIIKVSSHIATGREPAAMNPTIHNLLNQAFEKLFGWKVRDGVPVSGNIDVSDTTGIWGLTSIIFPIGDFGFVWSPKIDDLNFDTFFGTAVRSAVFNVSGRSVKDYISYNLNSDEYNEFMKGTQPGLNYAMPKPLHKKIVGLLEKGLDLNRYTDGDLKNAIKSDNEIFIKCDSYYLVYPDYYQFLKERFL